MLKGGGLGFNDPAIKRRTSFFAAFLRNWEQKLRTSDMDLGPKDTLLGKGTNKLGKNLRTKNLEQKLNKEHIFRL